MPSWMPRWRHATSSRCVASPSTTTSWGACFLRDGFGRQWWLADRLEGGAPSPPGWGGWRHASVARPIQFFRSPTPTARRPPESCSALLGERLQVARDGFGFGLAERAAERRHSGLMQFQHMPDRGVQRVRIVAGEVRLIEDHGWGRERLGHATDAYPMISVALRAILRVGRVARRKQTHERGDVAGLVRTQSR